MSGRLSVIARSADGFLKHSDDWTDELALELAAEIGLELTPAHWQIVCFIRTYYLQFQHLPNARVFAKALQKALGAEISSSRYLHGLFPKGPLKYACLIAGLPKPPGCL